jgi:hypothetical protein
MILDQNALFSDEQAIVASAPSTNHYDLGATGKTAYNQVQLRRNMDKSFEQTPLLIQVVESFNNATSVKVSFQSDDNGAFSSPKDVMDVTVLLADLQKGFIFPMDKFPRGVKERYIRLYFTVVGVAPTLGKITAGFVGAVDGGYSGNK